MQSGPLVSTDVQAFTSRVLVNGVRRDIVSWSSGRELSGDLPAQVVASSGIVQASGTIVWNDGPEVSERPVNPFNPSTGWLPKRGDRVVIYAGDGSSEWVQFTGLVDKTTGDVGAGYQSTIIDDYDKLSAPFSHDPLLRVMPPTTRGAAEYRAVGLTHLYYADAALRKAGFHVTPPVEARQILSVPAQSSMWPEVGFMDSGVIGGVNGGPWSAFYDGPDGVSIADVINTYAPALSFPMTEPIRLGMTVAPDHAGAAYLQAYYGGNRFELVVTNLRIALARVNGVEVCRINMGANDVRVQMLVKGSAWSMRTNTGLTATGTSSPPDTTTNLSYFRLQVDENSRVAGFHACHTSTSTENLYTDFKPTARYLMDTTAHIGLMDAGPAIEKTSCAEILDQISKATLTAMWIDELGVFNWGPSIVLRGRAPVDEVTTADDITSLSWEDSLLGVRSQVELTHDVPAVSKSRWDNILYHEGAGEPLESGQTQSEFISVPTGEDWIGIDTSLYTLKTGDWDAYNLRWGSFGGGVFTSSGETVSDAGLSFTVNLQVVDNRTLKFTQTVGALPADVKFEPTTSPTDATLWPRLRDKPLPVIRGFAKVQWAEETLTGATRGPSYAPVLVHEYGPWGNREDNTTVIPQRIADYISAQVAAPEPIITGLEVIPDPRRQLGDVITISSPKFMGTTMDALITGIDNEYYGSLSQSLQVRIISISTTFQTYEEFDKTSPGVLTYAQFDALSTSPQSYAAFDTSKED